ncbi:hypothetical protein N431DRAFT_483709 [Stipitochalara longipes BDJ]|nr:hypothetical protein N431DRAFT_483709 [Stipitochalara longipes BDJ]
MRRGANAPMRVYGALGPMRLSPQHLRETWPALFHQWRGSGNTHFNPLQYFNITNPNSAFLELWAWEYFATRLKWLEREDRFGPQPLVHGHDDENPLYYLYTEAKNAIRDPFGPNILLCQTFLNVALGLFERICTRLLARDKYGRTGYRQGIYMEVIEMARLFAPMISQFSVNDVFDMYDLLAWLDQMVGGNQDPNMLRRVTDQLGYAEQQGLLQIAQSQALMGDPAGLRLFLTLT